jgi:hypothetical protein
MSDRPTADEAARALDDVDRRRSQTFDSVGESRWVGVVFGVAIFLFLAAPDFFGQGVTVWTSWAFTAIVVLYSVMLRSRRGAAVLGRRTRLRRQEISPRFALYHRVVIAAVLVVGLVSLFVPHPHLAVPYLRTIVGALLGGALIVFGPSLQTGLLSLARGGGNAHGSR